MGLNPEIALAAAAVLRVTVTVKTLAPRIPKL